MALAVEPQAPASKTRLFHKEKIYIHKLIYFSSGYRNNILKAPDTIIVTTQINCQHKNLLGNEQWRAVASIKHCEKQLPLKWYININLSWRKTRCKIVMLMA